MPPSLALPVCHCSCPSAALLSCSSFWKADQFCVSGTRSSSLGEGVLTVYSLTQPFLRMLWLQSSCCTYKPLTNIVTPCFQEQCAGTEKCREVEAQWELHDKVARGLCHRSFSTFHFFLLRCLHTPPFLSREGHILESNCPARHI